MHQEVEIEKQVKFLRLNTGEDIISEMVYEEENNYFKLTNPLRIVYKQDALIMAFSPWVYFSICEKQEFPVFPNDVITVADPNQEIVSYYREFVRKMEDARSQFKDGDFTLIENIEEPEERLSEAEEEYIKEFLENLETVPKRKLH